MPIYDQSYRPYRGELTPHTWRWWTISQAGLSHHFSRKLFLFFLFITFIYPIVRGVIIWFSHTGAMTELTAVDPPFFRQFLLVQGIWLLLICIWPGATLIARDLKTNAIQLYLSRPLTRVDYVLGKFGIVAGIAALLLPVPALLLFLMEVGLSTEMNFLMSYFWVPFAILGYSVVVITGAGILSLALSAMTRSGRYAGLLFFAVVFFSELASDILRLVTGNHQWVVLSLMSLADQTGALFFGGPSEYGMHPFPAMLMYIAVVGLSLVILRRRVKAVEIVT